ncbi:MAG TPA: serine hydrolase [Caulobacteraceae bacterium]|jgi:beta-lactamase class A
MKALLPLALLALLLAPPALSEPREDQSLGRTLAAIAAAHHGRVGLFAQNLKTGEVAVLNPDEDVPTASTIKLTALYDALVEVRAGRVHFDDPLTLTKADQVTGSGILGQFDTPHALTFKDALTLMVVVVSDNTATNLVIDHLGLDAINARTRSLGLTHTVFYKKVFEPIQGPVPLEQPKFGLGRTTPREMAEVMRRIVRCDLGTPGGPDTQDRAICDVALTMLRNQFYRDGIPRYIEGSDSSENGSAIANKTGAIDDARNDVAAIATKNGTVILSVYTHDNADHGWSADDEGDVTIAKLAKAVIEAWSPQGLDARNGF